MLFGQGRRARPAPHMHRYDDDIGGYGDIPRKVTVFVHPSKRPYLAPFRRVQTFERLLQYISTLPHPQIQYIANANPGRANRACQDMLFSGQWQLVDSLGCIIRPEDWEELAHAGMNITVDTMAYESQASEETATMPQPVAVDGGRDVSVAPSQFGSTEIAGDLLEVQSSLDPAARQRDTSVARRSRFGAGGVFIPQIPQYREIPRYPGASTLDVGELEGEENLEPPQGLPPPNGFVMPPKPTLWASKNAVMSPSAVEFKPGAGFGTEIVPDENPILSFHGEHARRSMDISMTKPPSPPETIIAASKPDLPHFHYQPSAYGAFKAPMGSEDGGGVPVSAPAEPVGENLRAAPVPSAGSVEWEKATPVTSLPEGIGASAAGVKALDKKEEGDEVRGEPRIALEIEKDDAVSVPETVVVVALPKPVDRKPTEVADVGVSGPTAGQEDTIKLKAEAKTDETTINGGPLVPSVGPEAKLNGGNLLSYDKGLGVGAQNGQPRVNIGAQSAPVTTAPKPDIPEATTIANAPKPAGGNKPEALIPAPLPAPLLAPLPAPLPKDPEPVVKLPVKVNPQPKTEPTPELPRQRAMSFKWAEEPEYDETTKAKAKPPAPPAPAWAPEPESSGGDWGVDPAPEGDGTGWGDWSTPAPGSNYEAEWDSRGHVAIPVDDNNEWAPTPTRRESKPVEAPKPKKPQPLKAPSEPKNQPSGLQGSSWATLSSLSQHFASRPTPIVAPNRPAMTTAKADPVKYLSGPSASVSQGSEQGRGSVSGTSSALSNHPGHQKKPSAYYYTHFVPPLGVNAPITHKASFSKTTSIRSIVRRYAKTFENARLLALVENLSQNPRFNIGIAGSQNGKAMIYRVEAEQRLEECNFGLSEFWLSVIF
ncbi:hypothetical protein DRE_06446 [Drechslerella stenobrocha 248]|uniref:Uncharacterized protein n=1 Tax=Drechslerella stenobrocha 248 TaxID=1043628 RepID=W7HXZ8_9PEZI|nr:hypothetical protein DRE_06446 [Drechslerella stenobrocha 248]